MLELHEFKEGLYEMTLVLNPQGWKETSYMKSWVGFCWATVKSLDFILSGIENQ